MSIKKVYIFYSVLFLVIGLLALNLNYIEGDDARTILFHAFGRDVDFQPPYSPYHSMFDTLFSLLPTQSETLLRQMGIVLSFLSGLAVLLCLAKIVVDILGKEKPQLCWFLLALPFIIPETLFSSLIINPTNISFALVLLAHVFFIKYLKNNSIPTLVVAIVLFGLGVSFRWSIGFYIFVLYGHFVFTNSAHLKAVVSVEKLKKSFIVFPFFIVSVILWIQISGYSVVDIYEVFVNGSKYLEDKETSLLSVGAVAISFITPALAVLLILGVIYCIKQKLWFPLGLWLMSVLPYFTMGIVPMYKYMITTILPLVLILAHGFLSIKNQKIKYIIYAVIIGPWLVGLHLKSNSAWGPGFEVRAITNNSIETHNFNPDKSTAIENVSLVLGSGMAMPTPEGPRPLFGFGAVLLKDWKQFVSKHNNEREAAVNYAIENKCNILQDVNHSYIAAKLSEKGYSAKDELNASNEFGFHRRFETNSNSINIDVFKNKKALFDSALMQSYVSKNKKVVVYSSYTNIITKLEAKYNTQFEQYGAFWGVLTVNE
ncbi:glycosyltransferase family 39 protein [Psychroserpens sp. SPM9]|uniref:glycosyltransferase family 39 protein n=1 Tax=Psychroserpens sp. SPM9 TaxID=2975598 RepID=UPI0021A589B2|nr:glycosyltransferase family 39 protein [Psychroserpens sp. SPM9]MDG5492255.1 glycosyltransferase family 39 protein [Psychroserpens sp. SPM9]